MVNLAAGYSLLARVRLARQWPRILRSPSSLPMSFIYLLRLAKWQDDPLRIFLCGKRSIRLHSLDSADVL